MKYWTGSQWVGKPLKYWDGSQWVSGTLKYWDGSQWVPVSGTSSTLVYATVIEDFESDLSAYSGDKASASLVTTPVFEGAQALQFDTTQTNVSITDTDVTRGQDTTFLGKIYVPVGGVGFFNIGVQSETGHSNLSAYSLAVADRSNTTQSQSNIAINRWDSGSFNSLSSTDTAIPNDVWLTVRGVWKTSGVITLELYDNTDSLVATTSHDTTGDSTTYTSGGIGFGAFDGTVTYDKFGIA